MPELELHALREKLERDRMPYAIAIVISVRGSASAKPGSKMLISSEGKNLWGWVGGGCAESFTLGHALEAMAERQTRIVTADLDDEVFGLGTPCGGQMDIYIEPVLPPEEIYFAMGSPGLQRLAEHYGFLPQIAAQGNLSSAGCVKELVNAIARTRLIQLQPKSYPAPSELLILGHSRITEELAKLGALVGWPTRVYGINLDARNYPATVQAMVAQPEYAGLNVKKGSFVIVASHHKGDHHYIAEALREEAAYVGMVASHTRATHVFDHLKAKGVTGLEKVQSPAGYELKCRNPGEIALSIIAQLL